MATLNISGNSYNSYVTAAEALEYFEGRVHADVYVNEGDALSPEDLHSLVTATEILDLQPWIGYAYDEDQELSWPRVGSYYSPSRGRDIQLPDSTVIDPSDSSFGDGIPANLKKATHEMAIHLLENSSLLSDTGSTQSLVVGTIELIQTRDPNVLPGHVRRFIRELLVNGGGRQWVRSN